MLSVVTSGLPENHLCFILIVERETHTTTLLSSNTMQKFTTDRYDGQRCQVSIVSSSITIQGENNAVEIRFLDEAYLLDAVCSFIRYRHLDSDSDDKYSKLLSAVADLGETIRTNKAKAAA